MSYNHGSQTYADTITTEITRIDNGNSTECNLTSISISPNQCQDNKTFDQVIECTSLPTNEEKSSNVHPPLSTIPKIPFLDGLRGLASILVVFHHMAYFSGLNMGAVGVDIFFVLSAFLLTMLFDRKVQGMLRKNASGRSWGLALIDYASKRFLRIYPLFAAVAFALYFMTPEQLLTLFRVKESDFDLIKTLRFDPEHCHHVLWSLPVEIQYYFLIPIFTIVMVKLKKFWCVPIVPLYIWIIYTDTHYPRESHDPFLTFLPTFVSGSIAAIIYLRLADTKLQNGIEFNWKHHFIIRVIQYMSLVIVVSIIFQRGVFYWFFNYTEPIGIKSRFISVPLTFVIICEMFCPGQFGAALEWSILRYAGKIGYSIYLLHYIVMNSPIVTNALGPYDRFILEFSVTFTLATITYHIIEAPSQYLAMKISKGLKALDTNSMNLSENYAPVQPSMNKNVQVEHISPFFTVSSTKEQKEGSNA